MDCMRNDFKDGVLLDGRFQTISPLNHGTFGMVFMAKDLVTGEHVALKCLTKSTAPNLCPSAITVDDRSEELACHARLGLHPHIVNLLHHFETEAHTYLVLEFCSMGDLYEAIRLGRGPLETEKVREFMLQLVDAVEFMHSKGRYHRDIKPENIFLTPSGDMKLGDFGLATTEKWSYEPTVGSDRYMAPEQYDSAGAGYSPEKADIWAIGICLLNVLFSRNPFITPTESDPLFADFAGDKQSLFDIFPTMSQDAFEVVLHALALDPERRSLSGLRDALRRVLSFTTDDESLDEFCTEDRAVITASANRQPLRTPSIQSPQVEQLGSFPWAKALRMSPRQPVRQLSVVPDVELYSENVRPGFENDHDDWQHVHTETPSIASVLDSGLGASLKSLPVHESNYRDALPRSEPMPIAGSMPITTMKGRSAMSYVFGKKEETVSKSWSDLWDEEEEEEEAERERVSRSWSQDRDEDQTLRPSGATKLNRGSDVHNVLELSDAGRAGRFGTVFDGVDENDKSPSGYGRALGGSPLSHRYSPPRRDIMDKWAALGDRRRAYTSGKHGESISNAATIGKWRRGVGLGVSGFGASLLEGKQRQDSVGASGQDDIGDLEWVGGWHDLHL
ncbi:MAG: hypothetical protein M1833_000069 [Piccolia ochrophora]|nr:MAG: hypothetical protein M1833_000069 [Piccolia ochrophora]